MFYNIYYVKMISIIYVSKSVYNKGILQTA